MVHLKEMTRLKALDLRGCVQISDAGLVNLEGLVNLTALPKTKIAH
jgi:hypothetical protein